MLEYNIIFFLAQIGLFWVTWQGVGPVYKVSEVKNREFGNSRPLNSCWKQAYPIILTHWAIP